MIQKPKAIIVVINVFSSLISIVGALSVLWTFIHDMNLEGIGGIENNESLFTIWFVAIVLPYIIIEARKYYTGKHCIFFIFILVTLISNVFFLKRYWDVYPHTSAGWNFVPVYFVLWFVMAISLFIKKTKKSTTN